MSYIEKAQLNFENLLLYLEYDDFTFSPMEIEGGFALITNLSIDSLDKGIEIIFGISELTESFYIQSTLPLVVTKKDVPRVATALAIINETIFWGRFQLDIENLVVRYFIGHYYGSTLVADDQYAMIIDGALATISDLYPYIVRFSSDEVSIKELIEFSKENRRW